MTLATILLIEADPQLRATTTQALADAGFHVLTAPDTAPGVMAMYESYPNMVLLDEELPPVNDEGLCSYIRRIFNIPIVVLATSEQGLASVRLLGIGADVCLAKPPSRRLLLAWVNQLFWRYSRRKPRYDFPRGVEVDCGAREVDLRDNIIELSPTEFRLLTCLALNSNRLVPYSELAMGAWGREEINPSNLKFRLSCLRKKLANGSDSDFDLLNHGGVGYRFIMQ